MNRLQVIQSANGWLVISGSVENKWLTESTPSAHTFNSLDKAIAHIRKVIKSWHPKISSAGANIAVADAADRVSNSLSKSEGCRPKNKAGRSAGEYKVEVTA